MVQGLGRLERGMRRDVETFDAMLHDVKVLEDGLGEVDFWWVFITSGEKWKLPPKVLRWAETHHAHACGRVEGWLESGNWIEHRHLREGHKIELRMHDLGKQLQAEDWPSAAKEHKKLAAYLSDRLRKMHAAALSLNMDELESGLHELRRKVRWFSIYAGALEGAVTLDKGAAAPKNWSRYLTEAVVSNKYNVLPEADPECRPIAVPAPLFYAVSWLIADLGDVKDRAQWSETIAAGLRATNTPGEPSKWLGADAIDHRMAGEHARGALDQAIRKDTVLLRLADAIEKQG
jgi:hypothetical protein